MCNVKVLIFPVPQSYGKGLGETQHDTAERTLSLAVLLEIDSCFALENLLAVFSNFS